MRTAFVILVYLLAQNEEAKQAHPNKFFQKFCSRLRIGTTQMTPAAALAGGMDTVDTCMGKGCLFVIDVATLGDMVCECIYRVGARSRVHWTFFKHTQV